MGKDRKPLGFVWRSTPTDNGWRAMARFTCRDCGSLLDITPSSHTRSPEWVVQRAKLEGWAADTRNANAARCPACQSAGKAVFLGRKDLLTSTAVEPPAMKTPEPVVTQEVLDRVSPPVVTPLTPEGRYRELTYEQKRSIRTRLDATFDDKTGSFLDGMSDKAIGDELRIAWSIVRYVRERDYGMILPPSDVLKAERQLDQIAARVATLEGELTSLRGHLNAMRAELTGIRARYGQSNVA